MDQMSEKTAALVGQKFEEIAPSLIVTAHDYIQASPRTMYELKPVAATFPAPHYLDYEVMLDWVHDFEYWMRARWGLADGNFWDWAHTVASKAMDFNVRYNYKSYERHYVAESEIKMVRELGRIRSWAVAVWDACGGDRPVHVPTFDDARRVDLTPVSERAGQPVGTPKGSYRDGYRGQRRIAVTEGGCSPATRRRGCLSWRVASCVVAAA
jgi:hypothetical protein